MPSYDWHGFSRPAFLEVDSTPKYRSLKMRMHMAERMRRIVRVLPRAALPVVGVTAGLATGQALALYYETDNWAAHSHGGTDFSIVKGVTYTTQSSPAAWKIQETDGTGLISGSGDLRCSRTKRLANGVLKQDLDHAGSPFPVDSGDGYFFDSYTLYPTVTGRISLCGRCCAGMISSPPEETASSAVARKSSRHATPARPPMGPAR